MFRTRYAVATLVLAMSLMLTWAALGASDSQTDSFGFSLVNPYVAWDGAFSDDNFLVTVMPDMDRQYSVYNSFTVASSTPFTIEVKAEWDGANVSSIRMNWLNRAVLSTNRNRGFDIQISRRDRPNDFSTILGAPGAGIKTRPATTTLGEPSDAVTYGVMVSLVLVDAQGALPGGHSTAGWPSLGANNRRFESLPNGSYDVNVTVTITEGF